MAAVEAWWASLERDDATDAEAGEPIVYEGGLRMPRPRASDDGLAVGLVSHGEDAFDCLAHDAGVLRKVARRADPEVSITWTELHQRAAGEPIAEREVR